MITAVEGTIASTGLDWIDITVIGVTLRLRVPQSVIEKTGKPGSHARYLTRLQVKEDALVLYGFSSEDERNAFDALTGVNGVGPRVALNILSSLSVQDLSAAIESGEVSAFRGIPLVGPKLSNRIVLELKGKLEFDITGTGMPSDIAELIEALTALGYSEAEARSAATSIPRENNLSFEEKVRFALQRMGES